jgi:signal transduction histidine kinase/DNA-binding response OmpR family regulator
MMFWSQAPSISRKLTWMNMLVSSVALLTACSAFIGYDVVTFRKAIVRNLSIRAEIVGSNAASALMFSDRESAQRTLAALKADPAVTSAAIYTVKGETFASFSNDGRDIVPDLASIPMGQNETHRFSTSAIDLEEYITLDGQHIGTVYIRSNADALTKRLTLYVGISAIVLMASLLAALLVSSVFRKSVANPIVQLAGVARVVSRDKRYSLRVNKVPGQGEVSTLIDAFNEMMGQIEQKEVGLKRAHDQLEQRVQERTAELVSAQKEVEAYSQSILRAKEDIERASKFKDQFLSTMSHELRTPLNAVLGFSELLSDTRYGPLNERQQRYVNHIHTSGHHLLQLINDILDLSKIEAGRLQLNLEDVSVHAAFEEVSGALQPLVDGKSQSLIRFASPDLVVRADGTRFKQMLMNLLGNAIKFTPEGGKIELAARPLGDFLRIEVRDSGPGIPPEEKHRIFEAFHRLKQADKSIEGTGLGLAITRSLVELHGGRLDLESEPGSGSCFFFTLPAVRTPETKEIPRSLVSNNQKAPARILVIENDLASADLLDSQLASAGYKVVICNQPERAVEAAIELQPSAITLDIIMTPVNGWDILLRLKSDPRTAKIPVVVVTIMDQRDTGALLGADEYIVKPVDRTILLSSIERCLNQRGRNGSENSILVVEDDQPTREFITDLLAREGFAVRSLANGAQARAHVQAHTPNLIILDLLLPEVDGFRLIGEWRSAARTSEIPIFVLTNKDLTQEEKEYLRANTGAMFSKHELWQDALIRRIRMAVIPAIAGEQ